MDILLRFARFYWPLFYGICIFLTIVMFLLISYRTSRPLISLRFFLYPSVCVNFGLATMAFLTQVRMVNNYDSLALLCDGPCKYIGPDFCFHCYTLLLILITISGLINLHTLYYRTMYIREDSVSYRHHQVAQFSLHYLIPIVTLILTYIPKRDHEFVRKETLEMHPDYNLEPYQDFGGFADSHHFCMTLNTLLLSLATIYVPITGCVCRLITKRILDARVTDLSSDPLKTMSEVLIQGLTLQILLPVCCYLPVTILYCWNKYSGTQVYVSQYTLPVLSSIPCIADPILQIYFIMPYRKTIQKLLKCQPLTVLSPLTAMDRVFNSISAVYYPIFYLTCLILQFLLFFLILTKTSKVLRNMRWFLYPSNVTNMVLAALAFFLQVRNVNNTHSLALMCHGPSKFLGPWFCFNGYIIMLAIVTLGGVLNMHTLYYRMVTIKFFEKFNYRVLVFCAWYIFPVIIVALSHIPPTDFEFVYLETLQNHPNYDFEPYQKFGGFANSHNICMTLVTLTLVILASIAPICGYYWRRETLKILDRSYNSLSAHSIMQFKALIHGLGLQIMLPLFCYVPVAFFYIYNKYSGTQILISQYTLGIMMTLPAALDPILQISFIVPYRNAVKSMFMCRRVRIENSESARQNTITLWQRRKSSQPRNIAPNNNTV